MLCARCRKVYGIVACQLLLTTLVAATIILNEPLQVFCTTNVPFRVVAFVAPLAGLVRVLLARVLQQSSVSF